MKYERRMEEFTAQAAYVSKHPQSSRLLKLIRDLADRLERVAPDADGKLDVFDKRLLKRADYALKFTAFERAAEKKTK